MKNKLYAAMVAAFLAFSPIGAKATEIMPDFTGAPTGWATDRYQPNSFLDIGPYQGRDHVLEIGISSAQSSPNRPSGQQGTFYNTQGMNHPVSGGAGDSVSAGLYIETSWSNAANGSVRSDMWAVLGTEPNADYPIIGFTNYGGSPRLRVWDANTSTGWVDLATAVDFGNWMDFSILFTGSSYEYFVDGALVYTDATVNGSTGFQAVIMQAYNFGDPSIQGATVVDYTAHWSNTPVPEPSTLTLLGFGLVGLTLARRRRRSSSVVA